MKYIKGFDGLRAISILLVILTHLGLFSWLPENNFIRSRIWQIISGTTGVNIFFALSGFLITRILLAEKKSNSKISFKNFYARRFLRLLPPLILFYIAIGVVFTSAYFIPMLFSIFYLYNYVPWTYHRTELSHTWSLAIEEQFYILWPFIINFFNKKKTIILSSTIIFLCIIATYVLPSISFISPHGNKFYLTSYFNVERWFIPAAAPIMIGANFAILLFSFEQKIMLYFEKNNFILLLSLLLFASPVYLPELILNLSPIIQAIGISMLLLWLYINQNSFLSNVLEFKPLSYIGKISYGLYVFQGFFLRTGPGGDLPVQKFPTNIILTVITAIISYELIEKKVLKLKSRFKST